MELIALLTIVGLFAWAVVLVEHMYRRKVTAELRGVLVEDKNRRRFGELRNKLVGFVVDGRLDLRSPRIVNLYKGLTILMRYPGNYAQAARTLMSLPALSPSQVAGRPSKEEGEICLEMAERLDLLCRDYDGLYRLSARLLDFAIRQEKANKKVYLWVEMHHSVERFARKQQRPELRQAEAYLRQIGNEAMLAA